MKKYFFLVFFLPLIHVQASELKPYKMPRTQVIPIKDSGSGGQYELYIKLPEKYAKDGDMQHPVIYFTDAVWHIELLSASTEYLMEDAILVGISWQTDIKESLKKDVGMHVSRYRDYSINKSKNPEHQAKYQFGQASNHLSFIRNNVIPYVENNYRTHPNNRTYFGYSAGGVFGAYTLLAQPNTFKNYILGSPSLDGDIPTLAGLASNAELKRTGLNTNVFISYGTLENELGKYAREFIALLKNKNDPSLALHHQEIEGDHQAAFPLTGVQAITWLANLTKGGE